MIVSIIAAMAEGNRGIGHQGSLPWSLPAELNHFRSVTLGHTLIMGRKTYQSIGRPLPGRKTIVLTRAGFEHVDSLGVAIAASLPDAIQVAEQEYKETEAFIAGGGEIYKAALDSDIVQRMYLTKIHATIEADVFFPYFDSAEWTERWAVYYPADVENSYSFTMTLLEKDQEIGYLNHLDPPSEMGGN
jgi:dihydrofolate reductase